LNAFFVLILSMNKFKLYKTILLQILVIFYFSACESLNPSNNNIIEDGELLFFSLQDINPNSIAFGNHIGPQDYLGKVVLVYFTNNET
jgi:hypothetical protein